MTQSLWTKIIYFLDLTLNHATIGHSPILWEINIKGNLSPTETAICPLEAPLKHQRTSFYTHFKMKIPKVKKSWTSWNPVLKIKLTVWIAHFSLYKLICDKFYNKATKTFGFSQVVRGTADLKERHYSGFNLVCGQKKGNLSDCSVFTSSLMSPKLV